jgi:hypothetical protein
MSASGSGNENSEKPDFNLNKDYQNFMSSIKNEQSTKYSMDQNPLNDLPKNIEKAGNKLIDPSLK